MYRVVDWEKNFENNRTRDLKSLSWVPFPNKHDGDGYTELLDHENGAAHYGAWIAIVQVASRCGVRGTLLRDGARPHTAATLARMTRIPQAIMEEAIDRLVRSVGWLEVLDFKGDANPAPSCGETAPTCGKAPIEGKGREGNGREQKDKDVAGATSETADATRDDGSGSDGKATEPKYPSDFESFWTEYPSDKNGRRRGKDKVFGMWRKILATDRPSLLVAVKHYAKSENVAAGFVMMPERFMREWRDWSTDAEPRNLPLISSARGSPAGGASTGANAFEALFGGNEREVD